MTDQEAKRLRPGDKVRDRETGDTANVLGLWPVQYVETADGIIPY
jgi:hypothetical protein